MIEKTGDLFTTDAPAVAHGVNCVGKMGSGIAVQFRNRFPEMYDHYRALCAGYHLVPGDIYVYEAENVTVYNIASQDMPGPHASLEWLESGVRLALEDCQHRKFDRLALPQIGCGIGGLRLDDVVPLLRRVEEDYETEIEWWTYA